MILRKHRVEAATVLICFGCFSEIRSYRASRPVKIPIINLDIPSKREYLLRNGITSNFSVTTINFVLPVNLKLIKEIEEYYGTDIEELPLDITEALY